MGGVAHHDEMGPASSMPPRLSPTHSRSPERVSPASSSFSLGMFLTSPTVPAHQSADGGGGGSGLYYRTASPPPEIIAVVEASMLLEDGPWHGVGDGRSPPAGTLDYLDATDIAVAAQSGAGDTAPPPQSLLCRSLSDPMLSWRRDYDLRLSPGEPSTVPQQPLEHPQPQLPAETEDDHTVLGAASRDVSGSLDGRSDTSRPTSGPTIFVLRSSRGYLVHWCSSTSPVEVRPSSSKNLLLLAASRTPSTRRLSAPPSAQSLTANSTDLHGSRTSAPWRFGHSTPSPAAPAPPHVQTLPPLAPLPTVPALPPAHESPQPLPLPMPPRVTPPRSAPAAPIRRASHSSILSAEDTVEVQPPPFVEQALQRRVYLRRVQQQQQQQQRDAVAGAAAVEANTKRAASPPATEAAVVATAPPPDLVVGTSRRPSAPQSPHRLARQPLAERSRRVDFAATPTLPAPHYSQHHLRTAADTGDVSRPSSWVQLASDSDDTPLAVQAIALARMTESADATGSTSAVRLRPTLPGRVDGDLNPPKLSGKAVLTPERRRDARQQRRASAPTTAHARSTSWSTRSASHSQHGDAPRWRGPRDIPIASTAIASFSSRAGLNSGGSGARHAPPHPPENSTSSSLASASLSEMEGRLLRHRTQTHSISGGRLVTALNGSAILLSQTCQTGSTRTWRSASSVNILQESLTSSTPIEPLPDEAEEKGDYAYELVCITGRCKPLDPALLLLAVESGNTDAANAETPATAHGYAVGRTQHPDTQRGGAEPSKQRSVRLAAMTAFPARPTSMEANAKHRAPAAPRRRTAPAEGKSRHASPLP
ncbi:hypothetical protein NESM_000704200 [Novymonas esmeraldas]|uniref:Uncharacterized protein n=1 Tax=Novymonas esmeraldas TaxID=1808958 RepID=A0AAW0EU21_9TRYP